MSDIRTVDGYAQAFTGTGRAVSRLHASAVGYLSYCPCPDCRNHFNPQWPCGRSKQRFWETPIPAPPEYPLQWPILTCETSMQAVAHGPMSGVGKTQLCN